MIRAKPFKFNFDSMFEDLMGGGPTQVIFFSLQRYIKINLPESEAKFKTQGNTNVVLIC